MGPGRIPPPAGRPTAAVAGEAVMTDATASLIERVLADDGLEPAEMFDAPLQVAFCLAAPYEMRLAVLQRWRARADAESTPAVADAIVALETGAVLRMDQPDAAPVDWGYGAAGAREDAEEDEDRDDTDGGR